MRPSIGARIVYSVVAIGAMFAGLGIVEALVTLAHVTAADSSVVVGAGIVGCIPASFLVGVFAGRGLLKIRPKALGVRVQVSAVDLGALVQRVDLVSPRGPLTVRILPPRKRLLQALRGTGQMPPTDRVYESGPFA
ncbi:MAG TPA: hypothetical protein VEY12_04980 [Thermoplasmata archaeon]|nr:hypothetical protein [Thermoplasmata archaeon]